MIKGKVWIYRFIIIVGFCQLTGFVGSVISDACNYKEWYSAPFYVTVLVRAIEFLFPAIFLLIVGFILRKKVKKGEA